MRHLPRLILLAATAVILTACAQGTQTLRLSPTPAAVESLVGSGQSLGLSVEDARTDRDLGMLENPDGSIARLMPAQQITYTLQLAAAETLRGYDFEPSLWDEARTPRLEIRIETLDHQVTRRRSTLHHPLGDHPHPATPPAPHSGCQRRCH
jgi:uncharacterized lipoprotein